MLLENQQVDLYVGLRYMSSMTQQKKLTDQQKKFAELYVYNEGRMSPGEAAFEAGYKTRPRQAAAEMRNP